MARMRPSNDSSGRLIEPADALLQRGASALRSGGATFAQVRLISRINNDGALRESRAATEYPPQGVRITGAYFQEVSFPGALKISRTACTHARTVRENFQARGESRRPRQLVRTRAVEPRPGAYAPYP